MGFERLYVSLICDDLSPLGFRSQQVRYSLQDSEPRSFVARIPLVSLLAVTDGRKLHKAPCHQPPRQPRSTMGPSRVPLWSWSLSTQPTVSLRLWATVKQNYLPTRQLLVRHYLINIEPISVWGEVTSFFYVFLALVWLLTWTYGKRLQCWKVVLAISLCSFPPFPLTASIFLTTSYCMALKPWTHPKFFSNVIFLYTHWSNEWMHSK